MPLSPTPTTSLEATSPAASNGALVPKLRSVLSVSGDLNQLHEREKGVLEELILILERLLRTGEEEREELREGLKRERGEKRALWSHMTRFKEEPKRFEAERQESEANRRIEEATAMSMVDLGLGLGFCAWWLVYLSSGREVGLGLGLVCCAWWVVYLSSGREVIS